MKLQFATLQFIQKNKGWQQLRLFITAAFLLVAGSSAWAQDVLMGLNSNGGPEGKGTVYSYKTDTKAFTIIKGFANWGEGPVSSLVKGTDGYLYGMTPAGGTYGHGTIFKISTTGDMTILKSLDLYTDGGYPHGSLIQATDGNFYGLLTSGPSGSGGIIFRLTPDGKYSIVRNLSINTDGGRPNGHLIQAADGSLYGMNRSGGSLGYGNIFKISLSGSYSILKSFKGTTDGWEAYGSLVQASDGAFYGMTSRGGTYDYGIIFRYSPTDGYKVLKSLNRDTDAAYPEGDLVEGVDGYLYGLAPSGIGYNGVVFKIKKDGTSFKLLHQMSYGTEGGNPYGSLMLASDGYFYGLNSGMSGYAGNIFKINGSTGALSVVKKFTSATEGGAPSGSLIQLPDGTFCGMTHEGGKNTDGTIFKYKAGVYTVLAHMNGATEGNQPQETLALGKDSAYFGVTYSGGTYNWGTIFKTCGGVTTVLKSFNRNVDGSNPSGGLVRGKDGNLYGTTESGGTNGGGTIFRITPSGSFSVLRHLKSTTDGAEPHATLALGGVGDSALYGTTRIGGTGSSGTIFKITQKGAFTVLRHLVGSTDGNNTESGLVYKDGAFYGMTGYNTRFFKITPAGQFTVLKTLVYGTDGGGPQGNLIIGKDGFLYGALNNAGTYQYGVLFKIGTDGAMTKLRHLNGTTDGGNPMGGLVQSADGSLYGTTSKGGTNKIGTLFKLVGTTYTVLRHFNMATDGGTPMGGLIIAPKITLVATAQSGLTTTEDVAKAITLTGSGATNITYNILIKPRHGSVSTGTGAARTYTPAANYNGVDSFAFTTNLGCLASAPAWVKISVSSVNDAPVLATIGNKTVVKGTQLKFLATASDVDANQTKIFSLIGAPTGAVITTTGTFTWTPATTGTYSVKVRVTDNGSPVLYDEETITITVTATALANLTETTSLTKMATTAPQVRATLYPNPVVSDVTINLEQPAENVQLRIVDTKGAEVYHKTYNGSSKQLQVSAARLLPGSYIIMLQTSSGIQALKFVKQ